MTPEAIAAVCHEANRRYCRETGDLSQKPWEEAPWWQRQSAIAGVVMLMRHPDASCSFMHQTWMERKLTEGWKYGAVKNDQTKEHPCILPYDQLPVSQQRKDALFRGVAKALIEGDPHAE